MELNRNHYFMVGVVLLLMGVQLRLVESYVLNERATHFVQDTFGAAPEGGSDSPRFLASVGPTPRKMVVPPEWIGWALMSAGSVLILHSLAMTKPSG